MASSGKSINVGRESLSEQSDTECFSKVVAVLVYQAILVGDEFSFHFV
jgi:hypothetical protein